jgi:23S rRNA pseudouridine1911/1915/1917 synthase
MRGGRGGKALSFVVGRKDEGVRLDRYLFYLVPEHSRSFFQKIIREGRVLVDGRAEKPGTLLREGSRVEVSLPDRAHAGPAPEAIPIDVVYEDEHLAVVDKPAGLAVHPGAGRSTGTLVSALLFLGMGLAAAAGEDRPGIVHRLDKDTSGLLVVAKDDPTYEGLKAQFAAHTVERRYRGICWGRIGQDHGTVETPIGRHRIDRKRMTTRTGAARSAVTEYFVVKRFSAMTLVEFRLHTGRTHQIRVQMASIGHPIVGDRTYGSMRATKSLADPRLRDKVRAMPRQALHAGVLGFIHPISGETMRFESRLPADIERLLEVLTDEG